MTLILLSWVAMLAAQEQPVLDAARSAMQGAKFCFLISVDESGQPQTRLMEPLDPDTEMKVWFGTNPKTRKVSQIRRNPRVTLAYYDSAGPNYVTLVGRAKIVDTLDERRKRWRKEWETFYPGGPAGANFTLIEFTPARIELISTTKSIAITPGSLLPAILDRTPAGWKLR
jgi:general stress protein 26